MLLRHSLAVEYTEQCRAAGVKPNSRLLRQLPTDVEGASHFDVLDLSRNFVGPNGCVAVLALAENIPQLKVLNLEDNQLNNNTMDILCRHLKSHPSLTEINLARNPISLAGGKALQYLVSCNKRILSLELRDTLITAALMKRINAHVQANVASYLPSNHASEVVFSVTDEQAAALQRAAKAPEPRHRDPLAPGEGLNLLWAAVDSLVAAPPPAVLKPQPPSKRQGPSSKRKNSPPSAAFVLEPETVYSLEFFDPLLSVLRLTLATN